MERPALASLLLPIVCIALSASAGAQATDTQATETPEGFLRQLDAHGLPDAELVCQWVDAEVELRVLALRLGTRHPDRRAATSRVDRLRGAAASAPARREAKTRAVLCLRARLSVARGDALRLSQRYGVRHPRLRAVAARTQTLEAVLTVLGGSDQTPVVPIADHYVARAAARGRLAAVAGTFGPQHPFVQEATIVVSTTDRAIRAHGALTSAQCAALRHRFALAIAHKRGAMGSAEGPRTRRILQHELDELVIERASACAPSRSGATTSTP